MEKPTAPNIMVEALIIALIKDGMVDPDTLISTIDELVEGKGEAGETARHLVNCAILRATMPPQPSEAERYAERQRRGIRLVATNDGGNDEG